MENKKAIVAIVFVLLFLVRCSTGVVTNEAVVRWNKALKNENWIAKENIYKPFANEKEEPVIRKNQKLRLWLENKEEWLKVKFYLSDENREQARGQTIIFISKLDLEKITDNAKNVKNLPSTELENLVFEYIRSEIEKKLNSSGSR